MTKKMFIYALIDPRNEELFYIGQSKNPEIRLLNHLHKSHLNKTPKDAVLTELIKNGQAPKIKILEEIDVDTKSKQSIFLVSEREKFWINEIFMKGVLNIQNNNNGVPNATCAYCDKLFHKKHKRGKFCSNKCKVYWHRELAAQVVKEYSPVFHPTSAANIEKFNDVFKESFEKQLEPPKKTDTTVKSEMEQRLAELTQEFLNKRKKS